MNIVKVCDGPRADPTKREPSKNTETSLTDAINPPVALMGELAAGLRDGEKTELRDGDGVLLIVGDGVLLTLLVGDGDLLTLLVGDGDLLRVDVGWALLTPVSLFDVFMR